jgi:hypothetical protein
VPVRPCYFSGGGIINEARIGNWNLIRFYETSRGGLCNLKTGLIKTNDLAESNPAKWKEFGVCLDGRLKEVGANADPKTVFC